MYPALQTPNTPRSKSLSQKEQPDSKDARVAARQCKGYTGRLQEMGGGQNPHTGDCTAGQKHARDADSE